MRWFTCERDLSHAGIPSRDMALIRPVLRGPAPPLTVETMSTVSYGQTPTNPTARRRYIKLNKHLFVEGTRCTYSFKIRVYCRLLKMQKRKGYLQRSKRNDCEALTTCQNRE